MDKKSRGESKYSLWRLFKAGVKLFELAFYIIGIIGILYVVIWIAPNVNYISSSVGSFVLSAEMYARDTGMTADDFTRMVAPRTKESGTVFATAMRDLVVNGGQFVDGANERDAVELLETSNRLLRVVRPEQVRLLTGILEKHILNGNADSIVNFMSDKEEHTLINKMHNLIDGSVGRGMGVLGAWLEKNETQVMLDHLSAAPVDVLTEDILVLMEDAQKYNMAATLSKLANVLVKVTDALQQQS